MKINLHDQLYLPFYRRISYLYIPAVFIITSVLLDVTMFAFMHFSFPPAYIFSLFIMLAITSMICLTQRKWLQTIICSLLLGWQLMLTISNIIAHITCMEIFSLETLLSLGMAFNNTGAVDLNLQFLVPIILIILLYVVSVILVMLFCRVPRGYHHHWRHVMCVFLAFVSFCGYTVAYSGLPNYSQGKDYYLTNLSNSKFVYDTFSNRLETLCTFGSYSFYLDNLLYLMGGKTSVDHALGLQVDEFNANEFTLNEEEVLGEGYNLIMILMETFERAAINPITMLNLTKFMQESCVEVNGYYSMERTCFSDNISQTGMNPLNKEWWNSYGNVGIPHSLANIFNRSDYITAAFHNTDGTAYNRNKLHQSALGFQQFNNFYTYETTRDTSNYALNPDDLLFKENLEKIAPTDKNFYSYIITASTHTISSKYNFEDYPQYKAAAEYVNDHWDELCAYYPVLSTATGDNLQSSKNYLIGTYSFDQGFGALIDHLKNNPGKDGRKLIETTAIVMFGDHYSYVNPKIIQPENNGEGTLIGNRSPFIVYNPRQQVKDAAGNVLTTQAANAIADDPQNYGTTKVRFTSTMDIYPTVCSLFGVVTDQQLTYGHSIFDDAPSLGVGYINCYTWGVTGYDATTDRWQIWRTTNFVDYIGEQLTAEQVKTLTPLVNRTYASIYLNMLCYNQNRFKDLDKAKSYHLRTA